MESVEEYNSILGLIDYTGSDREFHKDYACVSSCIDLFGDQAAETGFEALDVAPGNSRRL